MYFRFDEKRTPLQTGTAVVVHNSDNSVRKEYIIDSFAGSGGFSLMYIAHAKEDPHRFFALKELFPRSLEDAVAERREDGRIVIYNPLTGTNECDDQAVWDEIIPFFEREVHLTRKAAAVYDSNGRTAVQNNPDVLGIHGPYTGDNGNRYIAVETKSGQSFQQFIDSGWETSADKGVCRNNRLGDILEVLIKTTRRLSALHGDHRMYHLDLSPANIYVSYTDGGTNIEPIIIDYGSAYDCNDSVDRTAHRFTCNPYSAPEVNSLAELNDQNAGYYVDVTSDTYSVAAMLFYAVTGELYTVAKVSSASWRQKIRMLYPATVYNDFAEELIEFFSTGMSADQTVRYITIRSSVNRSRPFLDEALGKIKDMLKSEDVLSPMRDKDELMSYLILDKYPLFRYFGEKGDIHVLCLGSGKFVNRMILSMISTGQMIGRKLFIHVVSADAEDYKQRLIAKTPTLTEYADFGDEQIPEENKYVTFTFDTVADLNREDVYSKIAEKYGDLCRYIVISLGANNNNISLARRFACAVGGVSSKKTIIHYYMAADCAVNIRSDTDESIVPEHVQVIPFGKCLASFAKDVHALGRKAFRVHYLYEKLYDHSIAKETALKHFMEKDYNIRSSLAAAVHIDYKLESIGISTADPKKMKKARQYIEKHQQKVVQDYNKKVLTMCKDPDGNEKHTPCFNELLWLEHKRWMMFMIADGYRLATEKDHRKYSFRKVNGSFNAAFKCIDEDVKTHHSLVPSDVHGLRLPADHREWDKYKTAEEIEESDYDALDRASLTVHRIARDRTNNKNTIGKIRSIVDYELGEVVEGLCEKAESSESTDCNVRNLINEYEYFKEWIGNVLIHKNPSGLNEKLKKLQNCFALFGENISEIVTELRNELAIFVEYQKYTDYKAPDRTIIENLLWVKYDKDVTLLKAASSSVKSNVLSALIIEPRKLVFLGDEQPLYVAEFFEKHGNNTKVCLEKCGLHSVSEVLSGLTNIVEAESYGNYVIDVTDGHPFLVLAACQIAQKYSNVGVIYCDPCEGDCYGAVTITNIMNYPYAPVHRLKTSISASEVFELYGGKEKSDEDSYMFGLDAYMEKLWAFYRKYRDEWEMISTFFSSFARGTSEFHLSNFPSARTNPGTYKQQIATDIFEKTGMPGIMTQLQKAGIVRNFRIAETQAFSILSFEYPIVHQGKYPDILRDKFDALLKKLGNVSLKCNITPKPNDTFDIDITSDIKVFRHFVSDKFQNFDSNKEFDFAAMEAPLRELENEGLISFLEFKLSWNQDCTISFTYNNSAIRDCLTTAGNILEAYVWYEAAKSGFFDSVKTNYAFTWANAHVTNELDVVLTKGLSTLVCSCKTAKMMKEHLYEVAELARRFSVNTKPVIIYSSDKSVENGRISGNTDVLKERAKEMGVYLIDKDVLEADLGAELVRIAKGVRD